MTIAENTRASATAVWSWTILLALGLACLQLDMWMSGGERQTFPGAQYLTGVYALASIIWLGSNWRSALVAGIPRPYLVSAGLTGCCFALSAVLGGAPFFGLRLLGIIAVLSVAAALPVGLAATHQIERMVLVLAAFWAVIVLATYGLTIGGPLELTRHLRFENYMFADRIGSPVRWASFFPQANGFAEFLFIGIIVALYLILRPSSWPLRVFGVLLAAGQLYALGMTGSRSSGVALVPAVLIVAAGYAYGRVRGNARAMIWAAATVFAALIVAALILVYVDPHSVAGFVIRDPNDLTSGRLELWRYTLQLWRVSPWVGYGFGRSVTLLSGPDITAHSALNVFIGILAETGVLGLAGLLSLWVTGIARAVATLRRATFAGEPRVQALATVTLALLMGLAIQQCGEWTVFRATLTQVVFAFFLTVAWRLPLLEEPAPVIALGWPERARRASKRLREYAQMLSRHAFAVLVVAVLIELFVRVVLDEQSPIGEPVARFVDSVRIVFAPRDSSLLLVKPAFGPLLSAVALPFNLLFDFSYKPMALATEAVFLVALLTATYRIGRRLFDHGVGLIACLLLACYPLIRGSGQSFQNEIPLAALVATTIFLALCSERYRNFKFTMLTGISVGIGTLTGVSFLLDVAPILVVLGVSGRNPGDKSPSMSFFARPEMQNLALASIPAVAIAGQWYVPRAAWLADAANELAREAVNLRTAPLAFLVDGTESIWFGVSSVLFVLLVVFGAAYFIFGRTGRLVLGTWGGLSILFAVTLSPTGLALALPAMALVTAAGVRTAERRLPIFRPAAQFLFFAGILFSVIQLYGQSYGIGWLPQRIPYGQAGRLSLFNQTNPWIPQIGRQGFNIDDVAANLFNDIPRTGWTGFSVGIYADGGVRSALLLPLMTYGLRHRAPKGSLVVVDDPMRTQDWVDYVLEENLPGPQAASSAYFASVPSPVEYRKIATVGIGILESSGPTITIYRRVR